MPTNLLTGEVKEVTQEKPVNLLPELTGIFKDTEGSTTVPEVSPKQPLINDLSNAFLSGLSRLWATSSRIPAGVYDLAAMPQNFLVKAVGRGDLQVQSPEWLMDNPIAELYDYQTEAFRKEITPTKSLEEALETKDFDGMGRHIAILVAENAPQQIGIILSYMAGFPGAGLAGMGMLETTQSLKEARKKRKDPAMSAYNALAKGVIEAGFESIGTLGILKKWSRVLTKSFGTKTTKQIIGDVFKTIFHSMLGEGNEEFWTSLAQDFSDFATDINPEALKGTLPRAFEAGTVGAVSGGLLTGPGAIRLGQRSASLEKMQKQVNQVTEIIKKEETISKAIAKKATGEVLTVEEKGVLKELERPEKILPTEEVEAEEVTQEDIDLAKKTIRDTQIRGRLSELDEQLKNIRTQIDQVEKERALAQEAGKSVTQIENKLNKLSRQEDVIDSEIAEILTGQREEVQLEKETIRIKAEKLTQLALTERIKGIKKGLREGKIQTKRQVKDVQTELIELFEKAEIDISPRLLKSIQTREQLESALPEIEQQIQKKVEKKQKQAFVKEIERLAKIKVDVDFREQIDEILEQFDLKIRTKKTKKRRESRQEFFERERAAGNIDFIPNDFFTDFNKKTLDQMSLAEVEQLRDQIALLSTIGATKNKLLTIRGEKDLQARIESIVGKVYDRTGKTEQVPGKDTPLIPNPKKGRIQKIKGAVDAFFATARKVEFITKSLQINQDIFETIQSGINQELTKGEQAYTKLKKAFKLISKNLNTMSNKFIKIEGVPVELTREHMIGIALNSGNEGNLQRLIRGNKFTEEHITLIKEALTTQEKQFVNEVFGIVGSFFPDTVKVSKKLYGIIPKAIQGKYFPIEADQELDNLAKLRAAERNLFQDIFHTTFVERGFTKERIGGNAPINLNVFNVIFRHVDAVNHYNTMAIPIRDIQKVINEPRFRKSITDTLGENVYDQFPDWLGDIANPRNLQASGTLNIVAQFLRHNSTTAILGWKITVSLLQAGSFTQTINEIGLKDSINGILQFYKGLIVQKFKPTPGPIEFIYSKDPTMKNRKRRFDREIGDWLKTGDAKRITEGKKSWEEMLFELIRGVDFITTMPSWLGAYEKSLNESKIEDESLREEEAVRFAAGVVRRTQPNAAMENLAGVMKGSAFQKLFTSFMTHFSNMHNQMVNAMDELKYSKDHPMRKTANFARSMWWLWIAPSLLAGWIRSGFKVDDWRKFAQELILYPFSGMFLIRDLMGSIVKGFNFGSPPGLSGLKEIGLTLKSASLQKKVKHGVKAVGLLTGKIPIQFADLLDGFIDLMNGTTEDFRRLIWSEQALEPVSKGILKPSKDDVPGAKRKVSFD